MSDLPPPSVSAAGSQPQRTTGKTVITGKKAPAKQRVVKKAAPKVRAPTISFADMQAAPGSAYSNGALDRVIQALSQQQFGGQQAALNQTQKAVPEWFGAYRAQVAQAQQRQQAQQAAQVAALGTMATQAAGDTGNTGSPLDPAAAQRATAAAQIRSAGVLNQGALAQNLGGLQQSFLGNLGALSQGQQIGAQQAVGMKQADLAGQIGAFKTTQHDKILSDEADAALKAALTKAQTNSQTANAAATKATTTKTKVATQRSQADQAYFKAHGYYPKTGPTAPKSPDVITSGAFAGYTKTQVAKMDPTKKQGLVDTYGKGKGKKAAGPKWGTPEQQGKAQTGISGATSALSTLFKANPALKHDRHKAAQYLLNGSKGQPVYEKVKTPTGTKQQRKLNPDGTPVVTGSLEKSDPLYASVALDMAIDGHVSRYNVGRLHARGIQIKSLGLPTHVKSAAPKFKATKGG